MTQEVHIDIPQSIYEKSLGMTGGSREELPKLFLYLITKGVEQEEKRRKANFEEEIAWFKNHPVILSAEDIDERAKSILAK